MATPDSIITFAALLLGSTAPGDAMGPDEKNMWFTGLNQMIGQWSAEKNTAYQYAFTTLNLFPGNTDYTVGVGGNASTSVRPEKILAWRARNGAFSSSGICLTIEELDAQAGTNSLGAQTALPQLVGADTNFPLLNLRVYPPPGTSAAFVDLFYFLPISQFASLTDVISMPPGYEAALAQNLAIFMYPQYEKVAKDPVALAANAQNTKASIVGVTQSLIQTVQQAAGVQQ